MPIPGTLPQLPEIALTTPVRDLCRDGNRVGILPTICCALRVRHTVWLVWCHTGVQPIYHCRGMFFWYADHREDSPASGSDDLEHLLGDDFLALDRGMHVVFHEIQTTAQFDHAGPGI